MFPHLVPAFGWAPVGMEEATRLERQGFKATFVEAAFYQTARIVWVLALATFAGFTATFIYDHARKNDDP